MSKIAKVKATGLKWLAVFPVLSLLIVATTHASTEAAIRMGKAAGG